MARIETIKKRADFLAVRGGGRWACACFIVEAKKRPLADASAAIAGDAPRFGFTVTKKLGNAVKRNRIRRRLKAAVVAVGPAHAQPQFDYVVVARPAAETRLFVDLTADMTRALEAVHGPKATSQSRPAKPRATPSSKKPPL